MWGPPYLYINLLVHTAIRKNIDELDRKNVPINLNKLTKQTQRGKLAKSHNSTEGSIALNYGDRALNIAPQNPDTIKTNEDKKRQFAQLAQAELISHEPKKRTAGESTLK